ncbi:MAG TPA: ROK family transcriptional regulator [Acidimicrobiales bacterium]|nr:ROK family transcriptional regulator [Acidimicrobiales bacterium]
MPARRSRRPEEASEGPDEDQLSRQGIRRADRQLMVDMNRNLVLNVLRTGAASRAEVVRTTGLSPATVSLIVSELIESGLVNEVGEGKSSGGRPPLVLRLDDERNYAVGVKLMRHVISVAVTDLRAEVVYSEVVDLVPADPEPEPVLDAVGGAVEDAIRTAGVGLDLVVGIGIGLAGLVDAETGVCRYSPSFGWEDVPVAAPIAERLGRPVLVDNDVNTLTVAEQWFGRGHGVDDFVVITVGEGVGAGIVVAGRLYRGYKGAAGEVGHMRVEGAEVPCRCGRSGCLEAVSSDGAVRRYLAEAIARGEPSAIPTGTTSTVTIAAMREAAEGGDRAAGSALVRAGHMLGLGIASLVTLLNPRLVILSGEGAQAGPLRLDTALATARERAFGGLAKDAEFVVDTTDDLAWARGAACIVLGELFSSPIHRSVELAPIARRESRAMAGRN